MSDPTVQSPELSEPTVPPLLRTRVKAMLYALLLMAVALFAIIEQDPAPLLMTALAAAVAWLVVDSPRIDPPQKPKLQWSFVGSLFRRNAHGATRIVLNPVILMVAVCRLFRRNGRGAPKIVLNLIVLTGAVYLLFQLIDAWGNRSLINALAHFIILLATCKLFEEKSLRDIAQIFILSLLIVISSAMFSNSSLPFALLLLVYIAALAYGMMLHHLSFEAQDASRQKIPAVLPEPARMARVRLDSRLVARNCALLVLPVALVVFLMVPRSRGAGFSASWNDGLYQTGFTERVEFHDSGQLNPSDAIALRVKFFQNDTAYCPDANDLYFRGVVLTDYSPRTANREAQWQAPFDRLFDSEAGDEETPRFVPEDPSESVREEYVVEPANSRSRFVRGPVHVQNPNLIYSPRDMTLHDASNVADTRRYTVYSPSRQDWWPWESHNEPAFVTPGLLRAERRVENRGPMALPASTTAASDTTATAPTFRIIQAVWVSPEITALARDLAKDYLPPAGQPIPNESIRIVVNIYETYLRMHYAYSLSFHQVDPTLDPTTDFLMNRKESGGHCEYFASAMVMLCRAVGLNARMVTGYHGGEFNLVDNSYTVRQRDSHTWVEVFVPGDGWVRSDPTPMQGGAGSGADYSIFRWGKDFGQMLQNYWLSAVVSFDNESRRVLWAAVSQSLEGVTSFFRDFATYSSGTDLALRLIVVGLMLGMCVLLAWGFRLWQADRRRMRLLHASPWRAMVPLSGGIWFVDEMFALLERHGESRRLDQTPREYVEQFIGRLGAAATEARWLIELAYEVRFGALEVDSGTRTKVSASLKHVKLALASQNVVR